MAPGRSDDARRRAAACEPGGPAAVTGPVCRVCGAATRERFRARVLRRHDAGYFHCAACGFLQAEEPHWLAEAYRASLADTDTGSLARSLACADAVSVLIWFLFDPAARHLDFAGGHGIFTRRMRDIGFDFLWADRYAENLLAKGFEYRAELGPVDVVTSFESLEHFVDPLSQIRELFRLGRHLVFTTELLPDPVPAPQAWYYYGLHHGQHVSFYAPRTLRHIGRLLGLHCRACPPLQLLTPRAVSPARLALLSRLTRHGLAAYVRRRARSRTVSDNLLLTTTESGP